MSHGDMSGVIGRMILTNLSLSLHAVPRDVLIDNLWEDNLPTTAESVLNATCSRLRRGLANIALPSKDLLISTGGSLQLRWPSNVQIDMRTAVRSLMTPKVQMREATLPARCAKPQWPMP